jgi:hypothetical protein
MRLIWSWIAILTALCTPGLASAQDWYAEFDALASTGGTNKIQGNYIIPAGGYKLQASGTAQIELISIKTELQYLSGSTWTSFNPKQEQTAGANMPNWSAIGWFQIQGGFSYRVRAVMTYRHKAKAGDAWTEKEFVNTSFQKAFP